MDGRQIERRIDGVEISYGWLGGVEMKRWGWLDGGVMSRRGSLDGGVMRR